MSFIHGANRHEEIRFPARLDAYMTAANPVRFRDALVDHLNLTTLGVQRAHPAATGRPAYDPADRLKRSRYGDLDRRRSSRRLAQEPHRHVELIWLLKTRRPAHKTSADLRKHTLTPRRQVCREVTWLCQPLDRFAGALVALDGSQFKAVNANERHVTPAKLQNLLQPIDPRVEGDLQDLDGRDNHDAAGTPGGAVAEQVRTKTTALQPRQLLDADVPAQ